MKPANKRRSTTSKDFLGTLRRLRRGETRVSSKPELKVHIDFDEEAGVWFVAKSDITGLHLESDNPFRLIERIAEAANELMELNAGRHRPAMGWRPIFDSPLGLQHA